MRVASLDLTPELFIDFCKAAKDGPPRQFIVKENPLPADAGIAWIGLRDNIQPYTLRLYIESESFADVAEYKDAPELPAVVFEVVHNECTELVS